MFIILSLFIFFINLNTQQLFPQSDFIIIGLPDTQYYSENLQGSGSGQGSGSIATFIAQTNWIVANRVDSNIVYVAHLGDCVQNGDQIEQEWINAAGAIDKLENPVSTGLPDGIPFGIAVGNHDMTPWNNPSGTSTTDFYNQYFGFNHFIGRNYYAGHYGTNNDNHYDLLTIGSLQFIIIYIKYAAYVNNPAVLNWANNLLSVYNDRYGIIISHRILGENATFFAEGQAIFDSVKSNRNIFLMLCGHVTAEARRTDINTSGNGRNIYTLLSDFQEGANGGDGYLRIIKCSPHLNKIFVSTYSPSLGTFKIGPNSQFELDYDFTTPLPIELAFFTGSFNRNNIELRWRTETEVNNYGFNLERRLNGREWNRIAFIEGHGNSNSPKEYRYLDKDLFAGVSKFQYRLKQEDNDGQFKYSDIIEVKAIPKQYELLQNYPNPFNPSTSIKFQIPGSSFVNIKVYDITGREVETLVNEEKSAGSYEVNFNTEGLSSGIYFYKLRTDNFTETKKMLLIK